ncbi:RHS repeat domain-containing protein, partial [Rhodanobacter sp. DHG33]|uniref:RHS repeat domain-containing protein n=1 Tax=Rhodanobacter sp. DHG33 TaxID=2775921 RepID=UPI00177AAC43
MRARWQGSCLWAAVMLVLSSWCHAQSVSPEDEYKQLIQVNQNIQPLGAHPFGENISLFDGTLSFDVIDISLPGNGPTIQLGRELTPATGSFIAANANLAFGDWDLDIPRIETITADQSNVTNWQTGGGTQRCTYFSAPPQVGPLQPNGTPWSPSQWWYGYHLMLPGQGSQALLVRGSENTLTPTNGTSYPIVTKQNWMVGCGVTADDGGEGFQAIGPDGTSYTFSHLVYHTMATQHEPLGTAPTGDAITAIQTSSATIHPMAATTNMLDRRDALMYVTQIKDRFGNTLTYHYDSSTGYLTSITANDGREVDVAYVSGTAEVQSITAKAANVASRTWNYSYSTTSVGALPTLTGVTLPDGSAWSYQLGAFDTVTLTTAGGDCQGNTLPILYSYPSTGTITQPSGLSATFTLTPTLHGLSYVTKECWGDASTGGDAPYAVFPNYYYQYSITSEVVSGAGLPTETWSYSYSPLNRSWSTDTCATSGTCSTTAYTDVTDPGGNDTRYTFSNRFDATEGLLQSTNYYSGSSSGTLMRSEINTYANPTGGPWPTTYGGDLQVRDNAAQATELSPLSQRATTQDGQTYTWQAVGFNAYAQPTDVKRYSNVTGQTSIEETTVYLNDTNLWVLDPVRTVTNKGTGEVEVSNTYNSLDELTARARFGETLMNYTWNTAGQLASFEDGDSHTTTLGNYYRGIPQSISYPDSTSETLAVDDLGQITSITDQSGHTTGYSYDSVGRIAQITYPYDSSIDSAQWTPKVFTYA